MAKLALWIAAISLAVLAIRSIPWQIPHPAPTTSAHTDSHTLPSSFMLRMGGNVWACSLGNQDVVNCVFRNPVPRLSGASQGRAEETRQECR